LMLFHRLEEGAGARDFRDGQSVCWRVVKRWNYSRQNFVFVGKVFFQLKRHCYAKKGGFLKCQIFQWTSKKLNCRFLQSEVSSKIVQHFEYSPKIVELVIIQLIKLNSSTKFVGDLKFLCTKTLYVCVIELCRTNYSYVCTYLLFFWTIHKFNIKV
jgi:hypothetical protein